jgi:hypothetical protein
VSLPFFIRFIVLLYRGFATSAGWASIRAVYGGVAPRPRSDTCWGRGVGGGLLLVHKTAAPRGGATTGRTIKLKPFAIFASSRGAWGVIFF